jgi:hypothetical protein
MHVWDECARVFLVSEWLPAHMLTQNKGGKVHLRERCTVQRLIVNKPHYFRSARLSRKKKKKKVCRGEGGGGGGRGLA